MANSTHSPEPQWSITRISRGIQIPPRMISHQERLQHIPIHDAHEDALQNPTTSKFLRYLRFSACWKYLLRDDSDRLNMGYDIPGSIDPTVAAQGLGRSAAITIDLDRLEGLDAEIKEKIQDVGKLSLQELMKRL